MINFKYFDTIRMLLRSGKVGDEYIQKIQSVKIVLGKIQLEEIPDLQYHVRITNYTELNENAYKRQKTINSNQFYVNYENGMVYFNDSEEGKSLMADYKGRGVIQYPAERIYVNNTDFDLDSQSPYAIDNLQKFLNFLVERTVELIEFVDTKEKQLTDFVNERVSYLTKFVDDKVTYLNNFVNERVIFLTDFVNKKVTYIENFVNTNVTNLTNFVNERVIYITKFVDDKAIFLTDFVNTKVTYLTDFTNEKVVHIEDVVHEYEDFVEDERIEFTDYIDDYIDIANDKIEEMDIHILASDAQTDDCRVQTEACKVATNKSIEATKDSIIATDDSIDLYNLVSDLQDDMNVTLNDAEIELIALKKATLTTRLIMQSPVDTVASIELTYPTPEIGWAVQTEDTGNIYRWNGVHWSYTYNLQSTISPATDMMNGLMTKEQFSKLLNIEDNAEVNLLGEDAKKVLPTYFKTKTVIFVLAEDISVGIQGVYIQIPFNGTISDIRSFCKTTGSDNTVLQIEKASESDFLSDIWTSIFDINENLVIPTNSKVSMSYKLLNPIINRNDYLRINIIDVGKDIRDITIQVNIII